MISGINNNNKNSSSATTPAANTEVRSVTQVALPILTTSSPPQTTLLTTTNLVASSTSTAAIDLPERRAIAPLLNLKNNKKYSNQYTEIPVLKQNALSGDLELCGFHALKNALLAMHGLSDVKDLEELFNDDKLFKLFLVTYATPYLKSSRKDASPVVVRQIFSDFIRDSSPPSPLALIQQNVKAIGQRGFTVLNMGTRDGKPGGALKLGAMDEEGLKDATCLYLFATLPGPKTLTTLIGNEATGHWYNFTIHKNKNGEYLFLVTDSLGASYLEISKMGEFLKDQLQHPELMLKNAYQDLAEEINRCARSIEGERISAIAKRVTLLDATPSTLLAKAGVHNGSTKERMLKKLSLAAQTIMIGGWLKKADIELQEHISDVEKLLIFYRSKLSSQDPLRCIPNNGLTFFSESRLKGDYLELSLKAARAEVEGIQTREEGPITPSKKRNTLKTFDDLLLLYSKREEIRKIQTSSQRSQLINSLASLGDEGGLTEGMDFANSIILTPEGRVRTFVITYYKAKEQRKLWRFCEACQSNPCLTGRMNSIDRLAGELAHIDEELPEIISSCPGAIFENHFYDMTDRTGQKVVNMTSREAHSFLSSLKANDFLSNQALMTSLTRSFADAGERESSRSFRLFLKQEGMITDINSIDWVATLPKFIQSPYFEQIRDVGISSCLNTLGLN